MTRNQPWVRAAGGANLLDATGGLRPTIFEEITALANQHGAVNLGQGFPDRDGPQELLDIARAAISGSDAVGANQYAPGVGRAELRSAIAVHQQTHYGITLDPDRDVLVTTGATEAIAASLLALLEPGDAVVAFEPFYDAYGAIVAMAGAELRTIPLRWPDFQPDHDEIRRTIAPGTAVVLLNTPHNPTGTVFDAETLQVIVEAAERTGATIISDEVYEHLVLDGSHSPIAAVPGARERTLSIGSAGKTFSLTGWKVGWLTGPAPLVAAVRTVKQFLSYSSGGPFQLAIATGLGYGPEFFRSVRDQLRSQRDQLAAALETAGIPVNWPAAGYFLIADVAPLGHPDAVRLAYELPASIGVAAIPVRPFVAPERGADYGSLLRFAFCKQPEVLTQAAGRLASLGRDR